MTPRRNPHEEAAQRAVELQRLRLCSIALSHDVGEADTESLSVAAAQYAAAVTNLRQIQRALYRPPEVTI